MLHSYMQKECHWANGHDDGYRDPEHSYELSIILIKRLINSKKYIQVLFEKYNCKDIPTLSFENSMNSFVLGLCVWWGMHLFLTFA